MIRILPRRSSMLAFGFVVLSALGCRPGAVDDPRPWPLAPNELFAPHDGSPVPLASWSTTAAQTICSRLERCRDVWLVEGHYLGEPCLQRVTRTLEDRIDVVALVAAGTLTWDPAAIGACLAAPETLACTHFIDPRTIPCGQLLAAVPLGGACEDGLECAGDAFCRQTTCPGVCSPPVGEGESCRNAVCAEGLLCDGTTCVQPLAAGELCSEDVDRCGPGLTCRLLAGHDHTGRCRREDATQPAPLALGESCHSSGIEECDLGLRCLPVAITNVGPSRVASACSEPLAPGAPCIRGTFAIVEPCSSGEYCDAPAPPSEGTCRPIVALSSACDPVGPRMCGPTATCDPVALVCVPFEFARNDEPCLASNDCYSQYCPPETSMCEPPPRCFVDFEP